MAKNLKIKRVELYKNHPEVGTLRKDNNPSNAYDYTDWLYISGRLTAEEHLQLKSFLLKLEDDVNIAVYNNGDSCCC